MNIIILGVRIIEDSDNRGSDNRGCTVCVYFSLVDRNRYSKLLANAKSSAIAILITTSV